MKSQLRSLCEFRDLCQSLDKIQCFLSQNASVLFEGIECENAVNLSMNCNSIDLNSCKISDKMLFNHNTINTLNTCHCFWPKCQFNTQLKGNLIAHQLLHSDIKQFKCDFNNCNKVFKSVASISAHKYSKHLNVRYVCDWSECDKQFTRKSYLIQHKNLNERKL